MWLHPVDVLGVCYRGARVTAAPAVATPARETWAPGLYPGVSYADYERIDAANHSLLRHYRKSPAHARVQMLSPRMPTAALDFGNAYHCAVLEPERFAREFVRGLDGVGNRSAADKAIQSRFRQQHYGKTVVVPDDFDQIRQMAEVLMAHETAAALLRAPGPNEVVAVWKDAETGLACKLRGDALRSWMGWTWVADLKTTKDASPEGWPREVHTYGYDSAAAWYLDGLDVLAPRPRRFVNIAQEKEPPFAVAVYELDEPSIEKGRRRSRRYLKRHAEALASNEWPAYPVGVIPVSLPGWSFRMEDDDDGEQHDGGTADASANAGAHSEA